MLKISMRLSMKKNHSNHFSDLWKRPLSDLLFRKISQFLYKNFLSYLGSLQFIMEKFFWKVINGK